MTHLSVRLLARAETTQFARYIADAMGWPTTEVEAHDCHNAPDHIEPGEVVWCEWGNPQMCRAVDALKASGKPRAVIHRIHDYELRTFTLDNELRNRRPADLYWFVSPSAQSDFHERLMPDPKRSFLLGNAFNKPALGHQLLPYTLPDPNLPVRVGMNAIWIANPRKRHDRAVSLLQLLPENWTLTIRADCSDERFGNKAYAEDLMQRAHDARVGDRLILEDTSLLSRQGDLHGPKDDVVAFWADKHFAVSLSDREACHLAMIEAAYCGTPPLVLRWGWGQPDFYYPGLVEPNLSSLARRLQVSVEDDIYYKLCKAANHVWIKHTPAQIGQQLEHLIRARFG